MNNSELLIFFKELNLIQEILPIVNFIIFNLIMNYLFIFLH